MPDGQQSVLRVLPLSLAGGAQVVVGTHRALKPHSHDRAFTAITGDVRVQGGGRAMRRSMRAAMRWWGSKHERGECMQWEVTAVLLLLCESSGKKSAAVEEALTDRR